MKKAIRIEYHFMDDVTCCELKMRFVFEHFETNEF